ncbi:GDP-mannose 4,6-dehydratase [Chryseobacterium sp. A301]
MTYLVTGGSGFIGSHLIETLLKNGHSVINVDNFDDFYDYRIKVQNTLLSLGRDPEFTFDSKEADLEILQTQVLSEKYRLVVVDIRDLESLRELFRQVPVQAVIHLAALAGVRPSIENPIEYQQVNVIGTTNLWELCKEFGIKKFLNASSSSVYGNNKKVPFTETDAVDLPISPYAASKRSTEILGHVYHHLYGMDMIHLRFFTVYGPRQRPDLAIHKFAQLIQDKEEIPFFGEGETSRDYTYIEDIIDGIIKALRYLEAHSPLYEIVNLGENQVVSLNEMVGTLESTLEIKAQKKQLPMQPGDVERTHANIDKAKALIDYSPGTNFQNGIKKFVEWFLRKPLQ